MQEQSDNKRSINVTDGNDTTVSEPVAVETPSTTRDVSQPEVDELNKVEAEADTTAPVVDNDHTLEDVTTQNRLSHANDALAREKTKRRSKPGLVLIVALLMALLGAAAGVLLYKSYFEKSSTPPAAVVTPAPIATSDSGASAAKLIERAKNTLKGTVVPTTTDANGVALTSDKLAAFSVPAYQPNGYDFYTVPKTYVGVMTATSNESVSNADILAVHKLFATHQLSAASTKVDADNHIMTSADYFGANVICRDEQAMRNYSAGTHQVSVACADMSSYADNAKTVAPLYAAYKTAKPEIATPGVKFGLAAPIRSETSGYQIAHVTTGNIYAPVGGSVAHFYQTPDKAWHYFANSQNVMPCSAYTTTDLKKAFVGQACATADGKSGAVAV